MTDLYKQVIVIRKDLNMRRGKEISHGDLFVPTIIKMPTMHCCSTFYTTIWTL